MVDTERTEAELLSIFADGQPAGSITPQDMRDFVVTANASYISTAVDLLTAGQSVIGVSDTSIVRTITISTADITNIVRVGERITIKDESGGAGTNNILIDSEGSETIDGDPSVSIIVDYGTVSLYSDGTNLFVV